MTVTIARKQLKNIMFISCLQPDKISWSSLKLAETAMAGYKFLQVSIPEPLRWLPSVVLKIDPTFRISLKCANSKYGILEAEK